MLKRKTKTRRKSNKNPLSKLFRTRRTKMITVIIAFAIVGGGLTYFISAQSRYFNPGRETSRQAIAAFLYRANGSPAVANSQCGSNQPGPFKDVTGGHEFCKEIEWLAKQNITSGFNDGTFRPGNPVSRQAVAVMMYRANGSPAVANSQCGSNQPGPFKDVTGGQQFCKEIEWLKDKKITEGFSDGTFRPTNSITRQATAAFLHRAAGSPRPTNASQAFVDVASSSQFYNPIQWLGEQGLAQGFDEARPDSISDTRRQPSTPQQPGTTQQTSPSQSTTQNQQAQEAQEAAEEEQISDENVAEDDEVILTTTNEVQHVNDEGTGDPNGTQYFNPSREVSRQAFATFLYRAEGNPDINGQQICGTSQRGPLRDVSPASPFCDSIAWLVTNGGIQGFPERTFRPMSPVTRQAAASFVYQLDGSPEVTDGEDNCAPGAEGPFPDISTTHRFCRAIDYVNERGYLQGFEDGTFRSTTTVSRQAAAAMLHRRAGSPAEVSGSNFVDVSNDHQFNAAIQWLGKEGISTGDSKELPRRLDLLTGQSLSPGFGGAASYLVVDLQQRLQARGFSLVTVTGRYDETTKDMVQLWQKERSISPASGNFVASRHLAQLQRDESRNWKISKTKVNSYLAQKELKEDPLHNQQICQGQSNSASAVTDLQKRLKSMGFVNVRVDGGYKQNTVDAVNFWRALREGGNMGHNRNCFVASRMLVKFRDDEAKKWRYDSAGMKAFLDGVATANRPSTVSAPGSPTFGGDVLSGHTLCALHQNNPEVVRNLQSRLNGRGWRPLLAVDGAFGIKTQEAVSMFKRFHNIRGSAEWCFFGNDYKTMQSAEIRGWGFPSEFFTWVSHQFAPLQQTSQTGSGGKPGPGDSALGAANERDGNKCMFTNVRLNSMPDSSKNRQSCNDMASSALDRPGDTIVGIYWDGVELWRTQRKAACRVPGSSTGSNSGGIYLAPRQLDWWECSGNINATKWENFDIPGR